jgi:HSP20 family protein
MLNLVPWKKKKADEVPVHVGEFLEREQHPVARIQDEFNRLFARIWNEWSTVPGDLLSARPGAGFDVEDTPSEYVVRAEVPGFEPEDFDINLSGNLLTIKAERKEERGGEGLSSYRYGSFTRSLDFPQGVEPDKIEAKYHSGVLEIRLPKTEETQAKRIHVSSDE